MIFQLKFHTVNSSMEYSETTKEACIFAQPNPFFIQDNLKYLFNFCLFSLAAKIPCVYWTGSLQSVHFFWTLWSVMAHLLVSQKPFETWQFLKIVKHNSYSSSSIDFLSFINTWERVLIFWMDLGFKWCLHSAYCPIVTRITFCFIQI